MIELLRAAIDGFKKSPLPTICGLLVGAVIYMFLDLVSARSRSEAKDEAHNKSILDCIGKNIAQERRFSERLDSIQMIELRKTQEQNAELERFIKKTKR